MRIRGREIVVFDDKSRQLDRFGLLFLLTVAALVTLSLVDLHQSIDDLFAEFVSIGASVLVGATLVLALRASGLARRWQRVVDIIVILSVLGLASVTLLGTAATLHKDKSIAAPLLITVLAASAPLVIVRRLIHHRRISRGTMFGAISAYLLLPIAFFYMFIAVNSLQDAPFFGSEQPTQVYMYFSLTSFATIGYGDYTAKSDFGRLLATSEAVVGQIYLVVFVAMLVGLFAAQWRQSRTSE